MSKDIKLNSAEWCDVVFEGKNKQYGAYRLRQSSSKRHIVAFLVILIFAGVVSALPSLVSEIKKLTQSEQGPMEQDYEMTAMDVEQEIPEENKILQEVAPPPPPLKTTLQFVPPTIAKDEEVNDENVMKSQDEVIDSKIQISVADIQGTDDKDAVDISTLRENKVIVQEKPKEEKPFDRVEVMPQFPGGEAEMNKFIQKNLQYPIVALESGISGRVTLRFVVAKDGSIQNVIVARGIDAACDKEALRVVKSMPKWIPGKQNGTNVAVNFTIPIYFRLGN